jgi:hypothetical protein
VNPASRYHLTLTVGGRPVMHGWWEKEATGRRKLTTWVGEQGRPGARIALVDEETGKTLDEWPAVVGGAG